MSDERDEDAGFDAVLGQLREVVGRLESGNLSLDQSLAAYERGVALARRGHDLLDRAEKRVELLLKAPTDRRPESTAPMDPSED